jgi:hypothetical protein
MRTARTTVLMTPEEKAAIEKRAASMGVSSGEYIRLAVDNYERVSPKEEAELAALVTEANIAIPKMAASLDRMSQTLRKTHQEVDRTLLRRASANEQPWRRLRCTKERHAAPRTSGRRPKGCRATL